jgi:hypothetical protein
VLPKVTAAIAKRQAIENTLKEEAREAKKKNHDGYFTRVKKRTR